MLLGGGVAVVAIVVLSLVLFNRSDDSDLQPIAAAPTPSAQVESDGNIAGAADAPITVVEWGDYQCPGCAFFWESGKAQLISDYVATGKVRFQFRDYAFLGRESIDAAVAASCAEQQGKFWEYHDTLYFNHQGENQGAFSESRLRDMAELVGLDMDAFNSCVNDDDVQDQVSASLSEGRGLGISSTPSFFVDGQLVSSSSWDTIRRSIDSALAGQ